jgi:hypothetical protein
MTSTYLAAKWLDEIVSGAIPSYMAMFTSDPQAAGNPLTVEITYGAYVRPAASWTRSGRILTSAVGFTWNAIPAGSVITHLGAFDAAVNGNFLWSGPVPVASASPLGYYSFPNGGYLSLAAGAYHVGLDS